jgi:hypothetical protein
MTYLPCHGREKWGCEANRTSFMSVKALRPESARPRSADARPKLAYDQAATVLLPAATFTPTTTKRPSCLRASPCGIATKYVSLPFFISIRLNSSYVQCHAEMRPLMVRPTCCRRPCLCSLRIRFQTPIALVVTVHSLRRRVIRRRSCQPPTNLCHLDRRRARRPARLPGGRSCLG